MDRKTYEENLKQLSDNENEENNKQNTDKIMEYPIGYDVWTRV
jgi:hypothetical protein